MAAPCWRGELQAALERPGQDSVIALQDGKVSLSLNDLLTSSSWIARQVWGAPPATGSLEDSESMTAGKKTVAVYVDKSSTCVIASLGALLAGCRFVDIPATSRASEVVRIIRTSQPSVVLTTQAFRPKLEDELLEDTTVVIVDAKPNANAAPRWSGTGMLLAIGTTYECRRGRRDRSFLMCPR